MTQHVVQIIGLVGVILTLTAVWLQWTLTRRISRFEDMLKDGRLTGTQMEQRIRWAQLMPVVFTLVGTCLLFAAVLQLLQQ
ncbi:MAG: hypothetical protein ACO3DQ_03705 [Cephaloticoccus sp.]